MLPAHWDAVRPICPLCWQRSQVRMPLRSGLTLASQADHLLHGTLHCTNHDCQCEFPVLDGIPLLAPHLQDLVNHQLLALLQRTDLPPELESLLGDCCGPASTYDTIRQHLSSYGWDHYGDLEPGLAQGAPRPGAILRLCDHLASHLNELPSGPVLDVGCSVGRFCFELAQRLSPRSVLGVDLNLAMLRVAQRVAQQGEVRFPLREVGLVYQRQHLRFDAPGRSRVSFCAADGLALPFPDDLFAVIACLNVLDCVGSPYRLLQELLRVLAPGGCLLLATPYDWSPNATPTESWLGGHSQRGPHGGESVPVLRALLTPGAWPQSFPNVRLRAETLHFPWQVRLHARSILHYDLHVLVAIKNISSPTP